MRQDWIVNGSKNEAEAFEARKRVEIEGTSIVEQRVVPTFSTFSVERYRPHAKAHLRATTWSARRYQLATLVEHFGALKLTAIGPHEIEAFKQVRLAEGIKPISINNELAVLQAVLSYARLLRVQIALTEIKRLPVKEKSRLLVWSGDQVKCLLAKCSKLSADLIPLVMFLANTGTRRGEALALRWVDIDLATRMIRVTPSEEWQPKSGRPREIPISDELHDVLLALPRRSEYVFTTPKGERYTCWPKRKFDRARKAAGLQGGPHTLRHTFASHFLKEVPDLFLLARVLGHSDTRVTKLYSHLLPEHLARARNAVRFAAPATDTSAKERAAGRWRVDPDAISIDAPAEPAPETVPGNRRRKR
ncbi:MAG: site-specific integrase [Deltaproteobacteria bacterium]|nr:site-specific integrase [Deltaproteobacteria bacterium]MDQ3295610.1 site-specific integrase [Myxococcota bacterium]